MQSIYTPEIVTLEGALAVPTSGRGTGDGDGPPAFDGGVYAADGTVCDLARHRYDGGSSNIPAASPPAAAERLAGTHLFGGVLRAHFGHFLLEGTGRLWAAEEAGPIASVLYLPYFGPQVARAGGAERFEVPRYASDIVAALGIEAPIAVVRRPVRVERLVVPSQLLMQSHGPAIGGHERFRDFAHEARRGEPRRDGAGSRIYVSRSKLPADSGGLLLETAIEDNLRRCGYAVLHPETMSIEAQLAAYSSAGTLLFAEGSALHLFALVARAEQRVGILYRRPSKVRALGLQVAAFGGGTVAAFDCVRGYVTLTTPGRRNIARQIGQSIFDFAELERGLRTAGFINGTPWALPGEAEVRAAVDRQIARFKEARPRGDFGVVAA